MSDHDAVICDINLRANPPANPKWNVYLYKRADMKGPRRKLKERFELFKASRPETKSPLTSSYHSEHSKTKDLSHGAMQTSDVSAVKISVVITLHVATEGNKFGVDLGIFVSWYIKNYS